MNIIKFTVSAAVLCLGITFATSCSSEAKKEEDPKEHAEEMNEEKFDNKGEKDADRMTELHMANLYEIMASEQAAIKATTTEVKKLAEMMKTAHIKMGKDMTELAMKKNITLPPDITNEQKRDMDKLNEKTGIDYDKEYTEQMKNKHDNVIKSLEKTADKAEDADIKQWAANSVPEIQSHITMLETCWNNIKDMKDKNHKDNDHAKK